MQIVIEISDRLYKAIQERSVVGFKFLNLVSAVRKGTPLQKGHGRLVDGDSLWKKMSCYSDDEGAGVDYSNDDENPTIFRDSAMEVIENEPTIIPADKGE